MYNEIVDNNNQVSSQETSVSETLQPLTSDPRQKDENVSEQPLKSTPPQKTNKKWLPLILLGIILLIAGTAGYFIYQNYQKEKQADKTIPTPSPSVTLPEDNDQTIESPLFIGYCKPDEDPNFTLSHEDSEYYYYIGNNTLEGSVEQSNEGGEITFSNQNIAGACPFILTKQYEEEKKSEISTELDISQAWGKSLDACRAEGEKLRGVQGWYKISVKGFKIPKSTVDSYEESVIKSHSGEIMFIDYNNVVENIEPMHKVCSITLP